MTDKPQPYQPSNEMIEKVMKGRTARQIAIAYLRAKRELKQKQTAIDVLTRLSKIGEIIQDEAEEQNGG